MSPKALSRRESMRLFGATAAAALFAALSANGACAAAPAKILVHRSPTCGCCGAWADRLRGAGFSVEVVNEADMNAVKKRLGVPSALASCHTAEIDGYVVEGHVPAQAIERLLRERPKAIGLAAPGMPAGSPGMETSGESDLYQLYLFDASGSREYGKFLGDKPL
jgi:hypothetical protein